MSDKTAVKLTRNKKLDIVFHKDTGLVFNQNRQVTGRLNNGEVLPFDSECLELCKTHGFPYDEALVSENEDETESKGDTEGEPDAEAETSKDIDENDPLVQGDIADSASSDKSEAEAEAEDATDQSDIMSPLLDITQNHVSKLTEFFDTMLRTHNQISSTLQNDIVALQKQLEKEKAHNEELSAKLAKLRAFLDL